MAPYDVIIPAYNAEATLGRAIDSALAQSSPPCEIVVVDDGSRDGTAAIAERYGPPVRVIRQPNAGPGAARNRGVQETVSPWVAFLDADDEWLATKMESQLKLTDDPIVGVICCPCQNGQQIFPTPCDVEALWKTNPIVLSSAVVRRTTFLAVGGFSEDRVLDPVADYHLWIRVVKAGWRIACTDQPLLLYNFTEGNLTAQIRRFAEGELACAHQIAELFSMPKQVLEQRLWFIYDTYARNAITVRDMKTARYLLARLFLIKPSVRALAWLTVAYLPSRLLDARRRISVRRKRNDRS